MNKSICHLHVRATERGASLAEYAFIAAIVLIPLIVGMELLQQQSKEVIVDGGSRAGTPAEYSEGAVFSP